ncbi:MAG: cassette chromosome recombinase B [Nitrospinaceae bacterium]|nr:MAG: cassette chromosome recombinase B [Nitrospinaceae bacterium]
MANRKKNIKKDTLNRGNPGYRIGLYIRVSTEEQASLEEGSIKNQEERLRQAVQFKNMDGNFGEIVEVFIDRAKSGKDTKRPALQKMLKAIQKGEINYVMASELSRISRSMKDFSEIWELMQEHGCGFQSLRENFETDTAAGEMVLYSIANIAQFERRQVSERVKANFNVRAKRGLFNGGTVPFGYSLVPDKPGFLSINEKQAKVVKKAYEVFLEEGTLSKTAKRLNEIGYRLEKLVQGGGRNMRLDFFTVDNLHHILTSRAYVGERPYRENGKTQFVKAVWTPLVDKAIFERVQKTLKQNKSAKKPHTAIRYPYLLTGIIFCGGCGSPLSGKSAHGKTSKIPYYEHSWMTKRNSTLSKEFFKCSCPKRFPGKKVEPLVLDQVKRLLTSRKFAGELLEETKKVHSGDQGVRELERLKAELYGFTGQLEALAERLSQLPKTVSATPIFNQMEKIEVKKTETEKRLGEVKKQKGASLRQPIELKDFQSFLKAVWQVFNQAEPEVQEKVIKKLIHKIELFQNEVKIYYIVDKEHLLEEPFRGLQSFSSGSKNSSRCSNSLTIGAEGGTRTPTSFHSTDFHTNYGFRRRRLTFVVWTIPSPYPGWDLGAARLVSTPSLHEGLGSGLPCERFPRI